MPRYGQRSDPQMQVAGKLMIASVGSMMAGSARSSNRTSRAPRNTAPCMNVLAFRSVSASFVLLVGYVFQPVDRLAIELLLHGDVRHRGGRRRAMPVLFTRRKPDDVTRSDLLDRSTPALGASGTGGDDQRLPERMRVPRGARAGLERHGRAGGASRSRSLKQRIDTDSAGEPFTRTLSGRLRTNAFDFHETPQHLSDRRDQVRAVMPALRVHV